MAAVGAHPFQYSSTSTFPMSYFQSQGSHGSSSSSGGAPFSSAFGATPSVDPGQLDLSEYMLFDEGATAGVFPPQDSVPTLVAPATERSSGVNLAGGDGSSSRRNIGTVDRPRTERIAFRTRSEIEILDDGYKWRKYGKKSVKNSPNPRNYYRCSTEGCNVKKRVERDKDDPSFVVTTYEGVHNHVSPSTVYYASQDAASGRFFVAGCQPPGS